MSILPRGLLCAFFIAASLPAAAAGDVDQPAARVGVWTGSVGKQKVVACFDRSDDASYYYLKHFKTIPLSAAGKSLAWFEGRSDSPTGHWSLRVVAPDRLEGEWSDPKGKRKAPIVLARSHTDQPGTGDCSDSANPLAVAFNAARMDAQKVARQAAVFQRRPYVKLSMLGGAVGALAFPATEPGMAAVNQLIERRARANVQYYFECSGPGQDFNSSMAITFWSKNWLSFRESSEGFCGGAYPFHGAETRTIDLGSGKETDLWSWFKHISKDSKDSNEAPAKLRQIILADADTSEPECLEYVKENRAYRLSLGEQGMVFATSFPHVAQACDSEVVVPYAKLAPFLSEPGKAALKTVLAR